MTLMPAWLVKHPDPAPEDDNANREKELIRKRLRCPECWARLRGTIADFEHHMNKVHDETKSQGVPMKNLIIAVALLLSTQAHAWEFSRNPDRFPSVAVNLQNAHLDGQRNERDLPGDPVLDRTQKGSENNNLRSLGADARLPLNDGLTLSVNYNRLDGDSEFLRQSGVYKETKSLTGYSYGFSLRLYFNK